MGHDVRDQQLDWIASEMSNDWAPEFECPNHSARREPANCRRGPL